MRTAISITAKQERNNALHDVVDHTMESLLPEHEEQQDQLRHNTGPAGTAHYPGKNQN